MGLRIDHYDWPGGQEALLRFGPDVGPVMIAIPPLFEEANRTRTLMVALLRQLEGRGIASLLPDVPGQGESTTALAGLTIPHMSEAVTALAARCHADGRRTYGLAIRSGALLDGGALHSGRWCLSPQDGKALLRDLHRIWRAAGNEGDVDAMMHGRGEPIEVAGNLLPRKLLTSLQTVVSFEAPDRQSRVLRLAGDSRDADRTIDAPPLWRRSEPAADPALADLLADDIATWLAACET